MAGRILVIEDNPANLELMRYLLEAHGYSVLVAHDGQTGIEIAARELPDLIICDIQLPGMGGYEVAQRLKAAPVLKQIPLIAVTAYAMVGDRDKILSAEFDGYFSKPIAPDRFVQQVQAYLHPELQSCSRPPFSATSQSQAPKPTGRTVLVVDNMQVNLDLATSVLEHSGYRVVTARGPDDGLELARRVIPDLILSDVCMDEGSGYDLIAAVKHDPRLDTVPFVFITSTMTNGQDRAKGLALGAAKFLFRPIEPQILLAEIDDCMRTRYGP